jgi:ABC-type polysaccharide/polyol phosphate export permease
LEGPTARRNMLDPRSPGFPEELKRMGHALSGPREVAQAWLRELPRACRALTEGPLRNPRLWIGLAWMDVIQNYRRSALGPAWMTLNLIFVVVAMTLIYGALFGVPTEDYAAFVACGMIGWFWVSALLQEMGQTFFNYGHFIKSVAIDKAVLIWATVFKQLITLGHHMVVYVALVLLGIVPFTVYSLTIIPALVVLFVISIPITATTSILFARYRDLSRLFSSIIVVLMMITPVFWQPSMLTDWRLHFVYMNPLYYIVEFIRMPLLGKPPDLLVVAVVLGLGVLFWVAGAVMYRRYQRYVVFWS